jgi:hypothetical protein
MSVLSSRAPAEFDLEEVGFSGSIGLLEVEFAELSSRELLRFEE